MHKVSSAQLGWGQTQSNDAARADNGQTQAFGLGDDLQTVGAGIEPELVASSVGDRRQLVLEDRRGQIHTDHIRSARQ
jgi:hypothetical protein